MSSTLRFHPVRDGLAAARRNLVPGLVLQALLLMVVLAYFFWPSVQPAFAALARLKSASGFVYSAVSTAVFGGLIPFLYLKFSPANRAATPWSALPFFLIFWSYKGVEIDAFYRLEAAFLGDSSAPATVIGKVLLDQFVYNPVWAAPVQTLAYHYLHSRYSRHAFRGFDWNQFWRARVPTTLISIWGVWIPLVTLIYCLPLPLQLPASNLALCFWVLLSSALLQPRPATTATPGPEPRPPTLS